MNSDTETKRHESAAGADYERDMTSRIGPALLVSILFLLIACVVTGFWFVSLPSRALADLQQKAQQSGFELNAASSEMLFVSGAGVRFNDVTLTHDNDAISGKIARVEMTGMLPWSTPQLSMQQPNLLIRAPLTPIGAGKSGLEKESFKGFGAFSVTDGQLRVVDHSNTARLEITNVSATRATSADGIQYKGTAGVNGVRTSFRLAVDDEQAMMAEGTPVDFFLTSPGAAETVDLQFSGRMRLSQNFAVDGRFSSAASDAQLLFALLGLPNAIPVSGPLAAESGVSISARELKLNDLTLSQHDSEAKGRISVGFEKDQNTFGGTLTLPRLSFAAIEPTVSWSEHALDLPSFASAKGKLDIDAQTLSFGTWSVDQPRLTLLADGTTASLALQAGNEQNPIEAFVTANQDSALPAFSLSAKVATTDVAPLLQALTGTTVAVGPANAEVNLKTSGRNMAEIVSKANGTIAFNLNKATLQGEVAQLVFAGNTADKTAVIQIAANVNDGLAVLDVKAAKVAGKTYAMKGEVDVLRKALALDITPQGGKRWGIAGAWFNPKTGADSAGAPEPLPTTNKPATDSN